MRGYDEGVQRHLARFTVPALLALASLLTSCVPGTVGDTFSLSGRVTQTLESGANVTPVAGATIRFTSDVGDVFTTTTGGDGRYRLQVLSRVRYGQVRGTAAGFVDSERTVYFDTPERRVDIGLRPTPAMMM